MFSSAKVVTFTIAIVLSTRNRTSWSLLRKKLYCTFYGKKVDDIVDSRVVSINFHRTLVGNKNFILAASNFLPRFSELEFFTSQTDPKFAREKKLLSFHNAEKKLPLQFWHTTQIASVWSWWKSFRSVNHEFDHSIKKFIVHVRFEFRHAELQELSHRIGSSLMSRKFFQSHVDRSCNFNHEL